MEQNSWEIVDEKLPSASLYDDLQSYNLSRLVVNKATYFIIYYYVSSNIDCDWI